MPQLARGRVACRAETKEAGVTGVVFEPFTAVQPELAVVERAPTNESYARVDFHAECEAAINEQIKWVGWRGAALWLVWLLHSLLSAGNHPPTPSLPPASAASSTT